MLESHVMNCKINPLLQLNGNETKHNTTFLLVSITDENLNYNVNEPVSIVQMLC